MIESTQLSAAFLKSRLLLFSFYYFVTCPDNSNGEIDLKKNEAFFRLTEPLFGRRTLCKLYTDDDNFAIVVVLGQLVNQSGKQTDSPSIGN